MGKMMSLLEKYKLVERDDTPSSPSPVESNVETPVSSSEDAHSEASLTSPQDNLEDSKQIIEELPSMPKHSAPANEPPRGTTVTTTPEKLPETPDTASEEDLYSNALSIEDVYSRYSLGDFAPTETVFLLENLIKALPAELPEFVKKTTIDNITTASQIDVDKLLSDGERRNAHLNRFINDFTTSNSKDITNLKQEIEKLSALIADYHQQIKYKELLVQEEMALVETEVQRINGILEFFKK